MTRCCPVGGMFGTLNSSTKRPFGHQQRPRLPGFAALAGALTASVGLIAHPWQHFTWARFEAEAAFHVSGQLAIGLTVAAAASLALAWPARRAHWRWPAVWLTWLNVAALIAAPTLATSGLMLLAEESVHLVTGHTLALAGGLIMALSATWLAGQEALPSNAEPWVHVTVLWDGEPIAHHAMAPHRPINVGHAVGPQHIDLPTMQSPASVELIRPIANAPCLVPPNAGRTVYDGRAVLNRTPIPLSLRQPAYVEFDRVALSCTLEPLAARVPDSTRVDERFAAAIAVSAALQLLFVAYAAITSEPRTTLAAEPAVVPLAAHEGVDIVDAVVREKPRLRVREPTKAKD